MSEKTSTSFVYPSGIQIASGLLYDNETGLMTIVSAEEVLATGIGHKIEDVNDQAILRAAQEFRHTREQLKSTIVELLQEVAGQVEAIEVHETQHNPTRVIWSFDVLYRTDDNEEVKRLQGGEL